MLSDSPPPPPLDYASSSAPELHRRLSCSTATYVVIASIVGTGILTTSGYSLLATHSGWLLLGLWLVGGALALCGALTVAELAAALPHAGGEYVYMREAYGPLVGFLYGWVSLLIGFAAPTALAAHAAARYLLEGVLPGGAAEAGTPTLVLAGIIVVGFTAVHAAGTHLSSRTQNATTLLKIAVLVALAVGGLLVGRGTLANLQPDVPSQVPWGPMAISLIYVMFSYTGWNAATYLAGEVREPARTLPIATIGGLAGVIALYLLLNVTYLYAIAPAEVPDLSPGEVEAIAATAARRLLGPWVARPLAVAIGLGLLATVSAYVLTGPRIYYAMARDGLFPRFAAQLDSRSGSPAAAVVLQGALTLALLTAGTFQSILTYAGVGLSVSSLFVIISVFVLRIRRPDLPRPFRTPLYPLVPLVYLAVSAWMIVYAVQEQPLPSAVSLASIAAGVPAYVLWRSLSTQAER